MARCSQRIMEEQKGENKEGKNKEDKPVGDLKGKR